MFKSMKKVVVVGAALAALAGVGAGAAAAAPAGDVGNEKSALKVICNHEDYYLQALTNYAYFYYFTGDTAKMNQMLGLYVWIKAACK